MKNLFPLLTMCLIVTVVASCGSSPYKKRKGCRGKGSWYGKRNLRKAPVAKDQQKVYVIPVRQVKNAEKQH